jgi:hypothetical protein
MKYILLGLLIIAFPGIFIAEALFGLWRKIDGWFMWRRINKGKPHA